MRWGLITVNPVLPTENLQVILISVHGLRYQRRVPRAPGLAHVLLFPPVIKLHKELPPIDHRYLRVLLPDRGVEDEELQVVNSRLRSGGKEGVGRRAAGGGVSKEGNGRS
jgi:hypothetical protein